MKSPFAFVLLSGFLLARAFPVHSAATDPGEHSYSPPIEPRVKYTINDHWQFISADVSGAEQTGFDDAGWATVDLPHTWNTADVVTDSHYRRGISWYRKNLTVDPGLKGKSLYLYFEAANRRADVYVNNKYLGHHNGGYSGFVFDITDAVTFETGKPNVIAVKVDSSDNGNTPPVGEVGFVSYGGIYRDVWLIAANPVHIDLKHYASSGVYIDTPSVSDESATVKVRGYVANDTKEDRQVRVVAHVLDPKGVKVASMETPLKAEAGKSSEFKMNEAILSKPELWSPENPRLHTLCVEIHEGDKGIDGLKEPFGFRWFKFDANEGFFLNGKHKKLFGSNRHQEYPGLGNAIPDAMHRRDMQIIKEMGTSFLRLAHYQQDPSVLEATDKLGILVWEEIPVTFYINDTEEFAQNCKAMLRELIYQHYNHPSIIIWGYMNEILLKNKDGSTNPKDPAYVEKVVELARDLNGLIQELDSSRYTAAAINTTAYHKPGLSGMPQIVGWNRYDGWYFGNFNGFGKAMDAQHKEFPNMNLLLSEYGAGCDRRIHSLKPDRMDYSCEYQQAFHESLLMQIKERPFIAGSAIWAQFDFENPYNVDAMPNINNKGLMYRDRTLKDIYFLAKANYTSEPLLHIASRDWNIRMGTDENAPLGKGRQPVKQPVKVYSNLERVELFANGTSLGTKKMDAACSATWAVPFRHGVNVLEAAAKSGTQTLRDKTEVAFKYYAPVLSDPSVPFDELAVNVGSTAQFVDQGGVVWEADQAYKKGAWGHLGGTPRVLSDRARKSDLIHGTDECPLYQSFLNGIEAYRFDVPDGNYEVELKLCDYENPKPDTRVFGLRINDKPALENVDLVKQHGFQRAFVRKFEVVVSDGQGVRIDFKPVKGEPTLAAVRVKKI